MVELNLRDSVVLITGSSDNPKEMNFGTGFIIHQDEQGTYVVTCAHVVKDVGGPEKVKVEGLPASVVALGSENDNDLAILAVDALRDKPVLSLGVCGKTGSNFMAIGYQNEDKLYVTPWLEGILGNLVGVKLRNSSDYVDAWYLKITNDQLVKRGNSGSPVIDTECNKVIAVVSHLQDGGKKGFAFAITALARISEKDKIPIALLNEIAEELSTQPEIPIIREVVNLEDTQEHLLTKEQREKLIILLCQLPNINYAIVRHSLVSTLPAQFQSNIGFDIPVKLHVTEIVDTVISDPHFKLLDGSYPLVVLIQNAIEMLNLSQLRVALQSLQDDLQDRLGVVPYIKTAPVTLDSFIQYLENFILQMPAVEYELKSITKSFNYYLLQPACISLANRLVKVSVPFLELATLLDQSTILKVKSFRVSLVFVIHDFNRQANNMEKTINEFCTAYGTVLENDQPIAERRAIQNQLDALRVFSALVLERTKHLIIELRKQG